MSYKRTHQAIWSRSTTSCTAIKTFLRQLVKIPRRVMFRSCLANNKIRRFCWSGNFRVIISSQWSTSSGQYSDHREQVQIMGCLMNRYKTERYRRRRSRWLRCSSQVQPQCPNIIRWCLIKETTKVKCLIKETWSSNHFLICLIKTAVSCRGRTSCRGRRPTSICLSCTRSKSKIHQMEQWLPAKTFWLKWTRPYRKTQSKFKLHVNRSIQILCRNCVKFHHKSRQIQGQKLN